MKRAKEAARKAAEKARQVTRLIRRILSIIVVTVFVLWIASVSAVVMWSKRDEARPAQAIQLMGVFW